MPPPRWSGGGIWVPHMSSIWLPHMAYEFPTWVHKYEFLNIFLMANFLGGVLTSSRRFFSSSCLVNFWISFATQFFSDLCFNFSLILLVLRFPLWCVYVSFSAGDDLGGFRLRLLPYVSFRPSFLGDKAEGVNGRQEYALQRLFMIVSVSTACRHIFAYCQHRGLWKGAGF